MLRKILMMAMVCLISAGTAFAQSGSLTGTVTDAKTGEALVGANVFIPELSKGSPTDIDGNYEITDIPEGTYQVRISYIGYAEVNRSVEISSGSQELNLELRAGVELSEMVVTALGEEQTKNSVTFATQEVDADQLNVTQDANIKTSLAGKVAGVQIVGQAGSKLGDAGAIRIRGGISLTDDLTEPLYVVDGVPGVDPNTIDINNVKSVNVLKGPNATALYGQRGESGVVILQTKGAQGGGVSVELNNSLTFQNVAYLPNYQNEYGQGYNGEGEWRTFEYTPGRDPAYFEPMDGARWIANSYADESWGPKLDGSQYGAWHNWFPDSPTYGQSTTWEAHPDNIKNFYEQGVSNKANFAISYAQDSFDARVSYSNLNQTGIIPSTDLQKHYINTKFNYDVTDAFNVGLDFSYTLSDINGNFADTYSGLNQTSGSFNQWFGRQLSVKNMKRFSDLKTPEGYQTNWNWWGPISAFGIPYGSSAYGDGFKKPAFWFNPFTWSEGFSNKNEATDLLVNLNLSYQFDDHWELEGSASRSTDQNDSRYELPYTFEESSDISGALYNQWVNAFGQSKRDQAANNFNGILNYKNNFSDWTVDALVGSAFRDEQYNFFSANMSLGNYQSGGLIIPNLYSYNNSREPIVPNEQNWQKQVFSMFARANLGYKDMVYINGSYRQDYSSALPENNNGYGYPSIGGSFVFTELMDSDVLTYGKLRLGWAQVGSDVAAERILSRYTVFNDPYINPASGQRLVPTFTDFTRVDPNIKPAINSSYEVGADLQFFGNTIGLTATYYSETREDEIVGVDISSATGKGEFLTNAGTVERDGIELSLDATPVQNENFQWTTTLNFNKNTTTVTALPSGLQTFTIGGTRSSFGFTNIVHELDKEYGQIRGTAIKRNENGEAIFNNPESGIYAPEQDHNYGSYLPDFTGGWLNNFTYKGISLIASIDFQKGGQFFSLSEQWGASGGLLEETAGTNDKGNPLRDAVADGGGLHVKGVDTDGNAVDTYVDPQSYYSQFIDNSIAEPYVIDADYIKLRELNLSYTLPKRWIGGYLNSARIGFVARNVWMIAVSGENDHNWDPSELAETWGENGQLPGTRSYGFNVNITF